MEDTSSFKLADFRKWDLTGEISVSVQDAKGSYVRCPLYFYDSWNSEGSRMGNPKFDGMNYTLEWGYLTYSPKVDRAEYPDLDGNFLCSNFKPYKTDLDTQIEKACGLEREFLD